MNWRTFAYCLPPSMASIPCSACPVRATVGVTAFNGYGDRRITYRCDSCMPKFAAELGITVPQIEAAVFQTNEKGDEARCMDCNAIVRWITNGNHRTPIEPNGVGHRLVCPCTSEARRSV